MWEADFSNANLQQANLHRLDDRGAKWTNREQETGERNGQGPCGGGGLETAAGGS